MPRPLTDDEINARAVADLMAVAHALKGKATAALAAMEAAMDAGNDEQAERLSARAAALQEAYGMMMGVLR